MKRTALMWLCSAAVLLSSAVAYGQDDDINFVRDPAGSGKSSDPMSATAPSEDPYGGAMMEGYGGEYGPQVNTAKAKRLFRILRLNVIEAEPLAETLKQMFPGGIQVTAFPRTNTLAIVGTAEQIQEAEKLVAQLDQKNETQSSETMMFGMGMGYSEKDMYSKPSPANVGKLKQQYAQSDKKSKELAAKYRDEAKRLKSDHPRLKEIEKQLQAVVTAAFEQRQDTHRAEIAQLEEKLRKMKTLIAARDRIKQEIIDRRVADLKNPLRQWDSEDERRSSSQSNPNQAASTSGLQSAQIVGKVLAIDEHQQILEISVGGGDGVIPGMRFTVTYPTTPTAKVVGQIEVFQVQSRHSAARIVNLNQGHRIKVGDRVVAQEPRTGAATGPSPSGGSTGNDPMASPALPGTIIAVNEEHQVVEASLGTDDGLKTNTRLHIWRGNRYIGEMVVIYVTQDLSVARIIKTAAPMRKGDQVGTELPEGVYGTNLLDESKASAQTTGPESVQIYLSVKVKSDEEAVAHMTWNTDNGVPSKVVLLPARINVPKAKGIVFEMGNVPGRGNETFFGTFISHVSTPDAKMFVRHNSVPVALTDEDFNQASQGNLLTKVFYLPKLEGVTSSAYQRNVEVIVSTRLDPGLDPVEEAKKRGEVLGILRLGNRESSLGGNAYKRKKIEGKPTAITP